MKAKCTIVIIISSLLLSGCWDVKDIVEMQYITGIGIDYAQTTEEYILYAQVVSFSGVAKSEQAATVPSKVWVANGRGKSLEAAMNAIYDKSNQIVYWAHIGIIIFSETLLAHGIEKVSDSLSRFQQIRETIWMYGTKDPIEEILLVTSLFSTAVQTTIFNPEEAYHVHSILSPIRMHRFYADFYEKGKTTKLPMVSIKKDVWVDKNSTNNSVKNTGVFLLQNRNYMGQLDVDQFRGLRWVTKTTKRSPLRITMDNKDEVNVVITQLEVTIKRDETKKGKSVFDIDLKAHAGIIEVAKEIPLTELKKNIQQRIKKEVRETYANGLEIGADLFNLEYIVYRKSYKSWEKEFKNNFSLTEDSIREITVDVTISQTGEYDYQFTN